VNEAGFITFDCTPPVGVSWQTHKFGLYDALLIARSMLVVGRVAPPEMWLRSGLNGTTILRTLPDYMADTSYVGGVQTIGRLGDFKVIEDTSYEAADNLWLQRGYDPSERVVCQLLNFPVTLSKPEPEANPSVDVVRRFKL